MQKSGAECSAPVLLYWSIQKFSATGTILGDDLVFRQQLAAAGASPVKNGKNQVSDYHQNSQYCESKTQPGYMENLQKKDRKDQCAG